VVRGVVVGLVQVASPLAFWWLDAVVASVFVVVAAIAVTGSVWWIVGGLVGHGLKDLWQHRTQFVGTTRWWPPFCAVVDFVAAAGVAVAIIAGIDLQ
jgi:hypothetical protein